MDSSLPNVGGTDNILVGDEPLQHNHADTKSETLTGPLSKTFTGGKLIGNFTIGSKEFLSEDKNYGAALGKTYNLVEPTASDLDLGDLTYPLWGQNVLDWRNNDKTHNNVPPSLNIYVKYKGSLTTRSDVSEVPLTYEEATRGAALTRDASQANVGSAAEAQYESKMVAELPVFVEENLTVHDYVLRMSLDGEEDVRMMRQGLQMLLDIFATRTNDELSTSDKTMSELLAPHLDRNLMPLTEFMSWYIEKNKQLQEIEDKIALAKELSVSVPPLNYIGRIIVSTVDDTEQKVVARYGGKRWRRIENFLRGVEEDDPEVGRKLGEDYVELRESNIPIHTHTETLIDQPMSHEKWMAKDKGGDFTKIVNTTMDGEDTKDSIGTKNKAVDYQLSQLEYANKGENDLTIPHDNLPPYMKVYIWECVELTDEERIVTGEPWGNDDHCLVSWLSNGGKFAADKTRVNWERKVGDLVKTKPTGGSESSPPAATRTGHAFVGWKRTNGTT